MLQPIIGRERELGRLRAALDDATPSASAIVLRAPAGAGKTTLWAAAVSFAVERRRRILEARPSAAEARLSYSALADLFASTPGAAWGQLPSPQRRALEIALLRVEPRGEDAEPAAIALGVAGLLRALAAGDDPLVIAIDDAQWLDRPSSAALAHALRRLGDAPIRLIASARADPGQELPDVLDAVTDWRRDEIAVGPMSVGGIYELLRQRAGIRLPRPTLLRVHEVSGGNPFFALEIGRAIAEGGLEPGSPLPLPHSLDEAARSRLRHLSPVARQVLLTSAALADPLVRVVLAAADDEGRAMGGLDEAANDGIVTLVADRVHFAHPLLASAAYGMASPFARRRVHVRLSELARDPEERAHHVALASSAPSERVAAILDRGADRARLRGAPGAAAELSERALALTPPERGRARHVRRLRAARDHFEAGDPARATRLLTAALPTAASLATGETASGREDRADLLVGLAEIRVQAAGVAEALELYGQALSLSVDEHLRARIHADLGSAFADAFSIKQAREHAAEAVESAERGGDRALLGRALAVAAYVAVIMAADDADDLLARAIALEVPTGAPRHRRPARFVAAIRALYEDRIDDARLGLNALVAGAEAAGAPTTQTFLSYLSLVERRAGRFELALGLADSAHEIALQTGRESTRPLALHLRAQALAHLGDAVGVRAAAEQVEKLASTTGQEYRLGLVDRGTLGFLELSLGNPEAAAGHLDESADLLDASGSGEPSLFTFVPDAIEAAVELGRLDRAELLLTRLEKPATLLGRGWALLAAARCHGLIETARGNHILAEAAFARSIEIHDHLPSRRPFELGRTLLALGVLQRRRHEKRLARETLGAARLLFVEVGARLWLAKADAEIARIGGRRARSTGLSATERRIADLVVAGQTNKEIATSLAISPKTVAWNLSKVYLKFGVRSRTELASHLRQAGPTPGR